MDLSPILARTDAVTRRIRLARGLRAAATTFAFGVTGIALALTAARLGWLAWGDFRIAIALGIGAPLALTGAAAMRGLPSLLPAELVDRAHALHGRFATALELGASPAPSPLAELAIADALSRVGDVSPARAFPIRLPTHARALVVAGAALLVASTLHRPPAPAPPSAPAPHLAPLLVHADDLALEHEELQQIEARTDPTPELRRAIDDTNALLEALEDRAVDRTEALRQLGELAARLDRPRPAALVAREDVLEAIGDRLGRGETTADLAQALREGDAEAARQALDSLADRLRARTLSADERRRLREALAEARTPVGDDELERQIEEAEAAVETQRAAAQSEESERLLEQRRDEVQRLREQHERRMEAERELERLERELGDAADDLGEDQGQDDEAADSLDDAAEDLNRTARDQQSEEQMQQLAQQLRQLREMIRRQREQQGGSGEDGEGGQGSGEGSSGAAGRMDRYVLRAGGEGEGTEGMSVGTRSSGGAGGEGQTEGSEGEGGEDDQGTPGGTSGSASGQDGEGGEGQGADGEPQQMLILGDASGESTAILELPGFGRRGSGDARGGGEGEGEGGAGAGSDHDPASLADPTDRSGDHRTVAVHGDDRGRGPSRSEVIRGGAARGFASRDYERVYADYEAHAERAIEEDEIPPGYRFYVRRYFDLIRPRD